MNVDTVLLIHAAATWGMVGLIWFVQLVHYPLFAAVGTNEFLEYELSHTRRTAGAVALFMPVEALTALWLVLETPDGVGSSGPLLGLALVGVLWLSTILWQAPLHGRLSLGFQPELHRRLVQSNWVRTALWSARGVLVLSLLGQALG